MCGNEYDKDPWSDNVMTITCKTILLKRLVTCDGLDVKIEFKVMHGMELMQMQGYDMSYLRGDVPESGFGTQLGGNSFNGFMLSAFFVATQCGSSIKDDIEDTPPVVEAEVLDSDESEDSESGTD
jgi:hypothetical protein